MLNRIAICTFAVALGLTVIELGESTIVTGDPSITTPAEAIVGRPLTPYSVAGVARRTVRRCAARNYYC